MTIYDMYQKLYSKVSVLNGDEISEQRLKAIVLRLKYLSENYGSNKIDREIEEHVKKFELCSEHLSKIESDLNTIDDTIKDSLSGTLSRSTSNNNVNKSEGIKLNKKSNLLEIIFAILTIVVSITAIVFFVLGIIDEINYDMLAFYITLGGAVVSLVGLLISRKKGRSSNNGKERAKSKARKSFKKNTNSKFNVHSNGASIDDSFSDNDGCDFNVDL